jgi:hypothetical protein
MVFKNICLELSIHESGRFHPMEGRKITSREQRCIADCIRRHWGHSDRRDDIENRDRAYEQCLTDCRICG